ncbi:LytR/AlgR family response regulator transcription factor [Chryseomicrobium palamuruense]|uniref:LytR/AlgR family response regulator transcription factor n=1 Tax=Chryseomicrobium palamuruense TaxID=682973 RepID=A0ABV8URX9_9BACL
MQQTKMMQQRAPRFLTVRQEDDWKPLRLTAITHMESLHKKTWVYADGEAYSVTLPLKELQQKLSDDFLRIHRSYIVNLSAVDRITRDMMSNLVVVLEDGSELPVGQSFMAQVKGVFGI